MSEGLYEYVYLPNPHGIGEDLEDYEEHGLHPVELEDKYHGAGNTYQIVHKLGYGGSSTVWVANNSRDSQLFAFKIISARNSAKSREEARTRELSKHRSLRPFLPRLLESFSVTGPNCATGEKHTVLIFDLLGPSIGRLSHGHTRLRSTFVRTAMYRTTRAVASLHAAGIVHRDLTANNIILRLDPRVSRASPKTFFNRFGKPHTLGIERTDNRDPQPRAPRDSVDAVDLARAPYVLPEPVLIDFEESGSAADTHPLQRLGIPSSWAAPEVIFDNQFYPASDVWSLGCIIYQARAGHEIFTLGSAADVFFEMVCTLGPPPAPLSRWEDAEFTDDGVLVLVSNPGETKGKPWYKTKKQVPLRETLRPDQYNPLKDKIFNIRNRPSGMVYNNLFWGSGECAVDDNESKYPRISPEEARLLYDLLGKIFIWDHTKRISAAEIIQHRWFSYRKNT